MLLGFAQRMFVLFQLWVNTFSAVPSEFVRIKFALFHLWVSTFSAVPIGLAQKQFSGAVSFAENGQFRSWVSASVVPGQRV